MYAKIATYHIHGAANERGVAAQCAKHTCTLRNVKHEDSQGGFKGFHGTPLLKEPFLLEIL